MSAAYELTEKPNLVKVMLDEYALINGYPAKNLQIRMTTFTTMTGKFMSQPFANTIGFSPITL